MAQAALKRTRIDVGDLELFRGTSYCVNPRQVNPFYVYRDALKNFREVGKDAKGICISRMHPNELRSVYGIENSYWLSTIPNERHFDPAGVSQVSILLMTALADDHEVALLDGVEHMSEFNDPHKVYELVSHVQEVVAENGKILIVPIVDEALPEKYAALYRRDLEWIPSKRPVFKP